MSDLNHVHHANIFNPMFARRTTVIGGGAVGSIVVDTLIKVGVVDLTVFDHDTVASHNPTMSGYYPDDIGKPKVRALAEVAARSGITLKAHERRWQGDRLSGTSVVSCVHDMPTRAEIWTAVKDDPTIPILCDSRTAGAYIEVYAINPCDVEDQRRYETLLFPETERTEHYCGSHGIMYASLFAAGAVVANLTRYWETGEKQWRFPIRCDTLSPAL